MKKLKFFMALWAAKILMVIDKLTNNEKNDRAGILANKICDSFLDFIAKPKLVIGVTGTNGKTTVSNLVSNFLELDGKKVSYNDWGANFLAGQTRCLLDSVNIFNKPKKDAAVLEIDEMLSSETLPKLKPNYVIITNLFRDSIKRNGYISYIKERLEIGLNATKAVVIVNADDPTLNTLNIKNKIIYYGIGKTKSKADVPWNTDFPVCPKCYKKIKYEYIHYRHIGRVSCDCGFTSHDADFLALNIDYNNMTFDYIHNKEHNFARIISPNLFNIFNELAVISLFRTIGYSNKKINEYIDNLHIPISRENYSIEGMMKFDLQVAKGQNGSSLSTIVEQIKDIEENTEIIIMLDEESCLIDKSETVTWLYETDFTGFTNPKIKKIIVCSYMYYDYKMAMMLNGVDSSKIVCVDREDKILEQVTFDDIERVLILFDVESVSRPRVLRDNIKDKYLKEKNNGNRDFIS